MTPEEFTAALQVLGWKASDFCRKAGVERSTPSRWINGKTEIPAWVKAYLGAMQDIQKLHAKYVSVGPASAADEMIEPPK
jgi:transcriptional regulator with XRE-family HTH domain